MSFPKKLCYDEKNVSSIYAEKCKRKYSNFKILSVIWSEQNPIDIDDYNT